jgi:iron(III) transport system ATP-binding protein
MLQIKGVSLSFQRPVLDQVSLSIKKGEILGLVGKSGAGKSSLLKIMAGLIDQDGGEVLLDGQLLPKSSFRLLPGAEGIEMVNQDFKLDQYHTVEENIRESILSWSTEKRTRRVEQMLKLLELKELRHQKAHLLSGGEQQRLAIARAISKKSKVLLLDEPFAHLDTRLRIKLTNYLLRIREQEQLSIVIVSHDGQDILGVSDTVCILKNGKLSAKKKPINVYYNLSNKADALLFGPINAVSINEKRVLFRPDEFTINKNGQIQLNYVASVFLGLVYYNYFYSLKKEEVILLSFEPLKNNISIDINKKKQGTALVL